MFGKLLGPLGFLGPAYEGGQMRSGKPTAPRKYTTPRGIAEIHRKALDEADAARGPEPDFMNSWGAAREKLGAGAGAGGSMIMDAMRYMNEAQAAKAAPPFEGPMPPQQAPMAPAQPQAAPGIPPSLSGMMMGAGPFGLAGGAPEMPQTSSAPWWLQQAQQLGNWQQAPEPAPAPAQPPQPQMNPAYIGRSQGGGLNNMQPTMAPRADAGQLMPDPGWQQTAMLSHGLEGNEMMKDFYRDDLKSSIGGLLKRALG